MVPAVSLYRGAASRVMTGGAAVVALYGPMVGGYVYNPSSAQDQGVGLAETLFLDIVGPALLKESPTTVPLQPGQYYWVPPGQTTNVWVNAATSGHRFTAIAVQPAQVPPTNTTGAFPPPGPTSLLGTLPSYLYKEYEDDDDLQALVMGYNAMSQAYVDWFNAINLPVYTQPQISGALLDWVGAGLYGLPRPTLSSGKGRRIGPFNTYGFNVLGLNTAYTQGPTDVTATSDDVYKRILTWHLYKGDGKYFNVRWLKRRVARFLYGVDGTDYSGQTYQISVSFGVDGQVNITIITGKRVATLGAFNSYGFNVLGLNTLRTKLTTFTEPPLAKIFKEAMDSGALEMPFQLTPIVHIGT